jgi:tetratricopeptide (TPR) repeat protein
MPGPFKAFVALSIALCAYHVLAQTTGRLAPGTGIITGTIQVDGGGSMAGVRVAVISVDDIIGANLISLSETDASGRYRLTDVPQGHYYVVAGRVSSFTYFPGGTDRAAAKEVVVEAARTAANINFKVPADSKRPPPDQYTQQSASEITDFQRASNERNIFTRIKLLLSFEKKYPHSLLLPDVYGDLVDLYIAKGDPSTAMTYGDKLVELKPDDVRALVKVSQAYGLAQINLREARRYAEKAVASAAKLKTLSYSGRPTEYRAYKEAEWASQVNVLNASAKDNMDWVNQVIAWNQKALNAALRTRH